MRGKKEMKTPVHYLIASDSIMIKTKHQKTKPIYVGEKYRNRQGSKVQVESKQVTTCLKL